MQIIGLTTVVALAVTASSQIGAAQHRVSSTSSRSPAEPTAEAVFAKEASKVVFLVASKSGVPYKYASGIILTSDGYIVTNYHALQGADSVEVRYFRDPRNAQHYESFNDAKILFESADQDIAVLKVGADGLPFAVCAAKGCDARIGEAAFAIGNPDELSNSISSGIVAGVRAYSGEDLIQHTAPISHGSSGGALFDSRGNLLGMNTSMMTDGQNLNFAISANYLLGAVGIARQRMAGLPFPPEYLLKKADPSEREAPNDEEAARQALKAIAERIRQCPKVIWFESNVNAKPQGFLSGMREYWGPTINVVWDLALNKTARSAFSGVIEFSVPRERWFPPEIMRKFEDPNGDRTLLLMPSPVVKYRYEFDLGSSGVQLTRTLDRAADKPDWTDAPPQQACSLAGCSVPCWEAAARNVRPSF